MSSGSSGYDPKYTSLDPSARADGKRYHVTRQKQKHKKKEKEKEKEKSDTLLKETPKHPLQIFALTNLHPLSNFAIALLSSVGMT